MITTHKIPYRNGELRVGERVVDADAVAVLRRMAVVVAAVVHYFSVAFRKASAWVHESVSAAGSYLSGRLNCVA